LRKDRTGRQLLVGTLKAFQDLRAPRSVAPDAKPSAPAITNDANVDDGQ